MLKINIKNDFFMNLIALILLQYKCTSIFVGIDATSM